MITQIPNNIFSIYLGDDKTMMLKALFAEDLSPLDLTNCTEIDIALRNQDGSFLHLLLTAMKVTIADPPVLGSFSAPITTVQSALLNVGANQDFTVTFTISTKISTILYAGQLTVLDRN